MLYTGSGNSITARRKCLPMPDRTVWFRMLPTTGRSAEMLTRRYGYKTLLQLANHLPQDAKVLDAGAGASSLGRVVATLRPDIHWINLDYSYYDKQILADVSSNAPSNLEFMAGDVTQLDHFIKPSSLDAVFSYWLFPHLSLYDPKTTITAAVQLYKATKSGGTLAVGPRKQPIFHHDTLLGKSWLIIKDKGLTADVYSQEVLRQTQLSAVNRKTRIAIDTAADELFGTSRYIKGNKIYDPKTQKYVSRYGFTAAHLFVRLLFMTTSRLFRPRPIEDKETSQLR